MEAEQENEESLEGKKPGLTHICAPARCVGTHVTLWKLRNGHKSIKEAVRRSLTYCMYMIYKIEVCVYSINVHTYFPKVYLRASSCCCYTLRTIILTL